ncbi:hypothetical protein BDZ88DRAFT_454634 [Geranomyces variabilis]|nr:hypothetical protein BDZ88DRAFT_454634 [Geranomyces variabilis]KAJ3132436.1 hypothetical protein HDU90_006951 [Geranomyces variabilis]
MGQLSYALNEGSRSLSIAPAAGAAPCSDRAQPVQYTSSHACTMVELDTHYRLQTSAPIVLSTLVIDLGDGNRGLVISGQLSPDFGSVHRPTFNFESVLPHMLNANGDVEVSTEDAVVIILLPKDLLKSFKINCRRVIP